MISYEGIEEVAKQLKIQLTIAEKDYFSLVMYRGTKDIKRLEYSKILAEFNSEQEGEQEGKQEEAAGKNEKESDGEEQKSEKNDQNYEDNFEEEKEPESQLKPEPKEEEKLEPKKVEEEEEEKIQPKEEKQTEQEAAGEDLDFNDDKMIEIAQECFLKLYTKLTEHNTTIQKHFKDSIVTKTFEGEEQQVIPAEDFIKGIKSLGLNDLKQIEYTCLIGVLAISEQEKFIKVNDVAQILDDFKVADNTEEVSKPEAKKSHSSLKFEELDEISMVLMLALTEYIVKAQIPLTKLFENKIFKQTLQRNNKQKVVEMIKATDFFEALEGIGIKTEEKDHENLNKFLCISSHHQDKISLAKLKEAVEAFAFNEELREIAHKCYRDLAGEDEESEAEKQQPNE